MEKGHPTVSEAEDEVGQEVGDEISFLLLITVLLVAHLGEFLFFFIQLLILYFKQACGLILILTIKLKKYYIWKDSWIS